jgi:hypothetical protein
VPSSLSFRSKPYDFVSCLSLLKVIPPIPEVILPSLSGKIFESREIHLDDICWMGEQGFAGWIGVRNNGGRSEEEYHSTVYRPFSF